MSTSLTVLDLSVLSLVSGGAGSFAEFTNKQREDVSSAYKNVVCTTAGIKGAPDLAGGVYGPNASDTDKIRAAEMLKSYCQGGAALPAQAPKAPF